MSRTIIPSAVVSSLLDELSREEDELRSQRETLQKKIEQVMAKRQAMNDLLKIAAKTGEANGNGRQKFSDAVIELVRTSPGLTRAAIVDKLFDEYKSEKAKDPRRSLVTQIGNLARRGKLMLIDQKVYPPGLAPRKEARVRFDEADIADQ